MLASTNFQFLLVFNLGCASTSRWYWLWRIFTTSDHIPYGMNF